MARGRRTEGGLERSRGKWFLRYQRDGKRHRIKLNAGNAKDAKGEAEPMLVALRAREATTRQAALVGALVAADLAKAAAPVALKEGWTLLTDCWRKWPLTVSVARGRRGQPLVPRSAQDNEIQWRKFLEWVVAHRPEVLHLEQVTADLCQQYSSDLLVDGYTVHRVNMRLGTVASMFKLAGKPSPVTPDIRQVEKHEHREPPTTIQVTEAIKAASGETRRLLLVLATTGLRLGDACRLDWSDFRGGMMYRRTSKTGSAVALPVHPALQEDLDMTPARQRHGPIMPGLAAEYQRSDGSGMSARLSHHFTKCGWTVTEAADGRRRAISRMSVHSLRTFFATEAHRAGAPIDVVRQWLGHTSSTVTRVYAQAPMEQGRELLASTLPGLTQQKSPALLPSYEPERDQLVALVKALPIAHVHQVLAFAKGLPT